MCLRSDNPFFHPYSRFNMCQETNGELRPFSFPFPALSTCGLHISPTSLLRLFIMLCCTFPLCSGLGRSLRRITASRTLGLNSLHPPQPRPLRSLLGPVGDKSGLGMEGLAMQCTRQMKLSRAAEQLYCRKRVLGAAVSRSWVVLNAVCRVCAGAFDSCFSCCLHNHHRQQYQHYVPPAVFLSPPPSPSHS